jgi:NTP pyrophosphatase (non-canonical NTP hydrolase)
MSRLVYLVVPTYAKSSCDAYFDFKSAQAAANKLGGPSMASVVTVGAMSLNAVAKEAYEVARSKGFWDGDAAHISNKLLLIHSEVSEAAEEYRIGLFCENFRKEIADVLIRTLDLAYGLGMDVEVAVREKMEHNRTRPKLHGKKF